MDIIEEEVKEYYLVYEDVHGYGYAFPCDHDGNLLLQKISSPAVVWENLAYCESHPEKWSKNGEVVTRIRHERYGVCPYCGRRVSLYGEGYFGAFVCACGQWYNVFGQALKPPDEWGEY